MDLTNTLGGPSGGGGGSGGPTLIPTPMATPTPPPPAAGGAMPMPAGSFFPAMVAPGAAAAAAPSPGVMLAAGAAGAPPTLLNMAGMPMMPVAGAAGTPMNLALFQHQQQQQQLAMFYEQQRQLQQQQEVQLITAQIDRINTERQQQQQLQAPPVPSSDAVLAPPTVSSVVAISPEPTRSASESAMSFLDDANSVSVVQLADAAYSSPFGAPGAVADDTDPFTMMAHRHGSNTASSTSTIPGASNLLVPLDLAGAPVSVGGQHLPPTSSSTAVQLNNSSSNADANSQQQQQQHEEHDGALAGSQLRSVLSSSCSHRTALEQKLSIEKEVQALHASLWVFQDQPRVLEGLCACQMRVNYQYIIKIATFHEALFQQLKSKFEYLHQYNVRSVFLSLYEQTFYEMQLSRQVHSKIQELVSNDRLSDHALVRESLQLLDALFGLLVHPYKPLSGHSAQLVHGLILLLGFVVLDRTQAHQRSSNDSDTSAAAAASAPEPAAPPTVDLLGLLPEPSPAATPRTTTAADNATDSSLDTQVQTYFLRQLRECHGFKWGASLIQPTWQQMIGSNLLDLAIGGGTLEPEEDYIALLAQYPWRDMATITSSTDDATLMNAVLMPLQKLLQRVCSTEKPYLSLMLLIAKIVATIADCAPHLTGKCLSILTRTPWPSKGVSVAILRFLPWDQLRATELQTIFAELYHLFDQTALEYAALPEPQRQAHRTQFANYLVASHPVIEQVLQIDSQLSFGITFPILFAFAEIALHAPEGGAFQRMILQELFFLGFSIDTRRNPLVAQLAKEAGMFVSSFCHSFPVLLSTLVFAIGQNLPNLSVNSVIPLLEHRLFSHWLVDIYSINWIAYFFAHRTSSGAATSPAASAAAGSTQPVAGDVRAIESLTHLFLITSPTLQFGQEISHNGKLIGKQLFEIIPWHLAPAPLKLHAALILVAAKDFVDQAWLYDTLLGRVGHDLTSGFHGEAEFALVNRVLAVSAETTRFPDETMMLQTLLAIGIVESRYVQWRQSGEAAFADDGAAWLERIGIYGRLQHLLAKAEYRCVYKLLHHLMMVIKAEERLSRAAVPLSAFVRDFVLCAPNNVNLLSGLMKETLSAPHSDQEHLQWLRLWIDVLLPHVPEHDAFCRLLGDLILGMWCELRPSSSYVAPVLNSVSESLATRRIEQRKVLELAQRGHGALLLGVLRSYVPQLPPPTNVSDQNNALWLLRHVATAQLHAPAALALWERFFEVFFAAEEQHRLDMAAVLPTATREAMNRHFVAVAKQAFESQPLKCVQRVYYAFTMWRRDVIGAATGEIFPEEHSAANELKDTVLNRLAPHLYQRLRPSTDDDDHGDRAAAAAIVSSTSTSTSTSTSASASTSNDGSAPVTSDSGILVRRETRDRLRKLQSLLPKRTPPPSNKLGSHLDQFSSLEQAIENAVSFFVELEATIAQQIEQQSNAARSGHRRQHSSVQDVQIPVVQQIELLLKVYDNLNASLRDLDSQFLELTRHSYYNFTTPFQVRVPCPQGIRCSGPAVLTGENIRIEPVNPQIPGALATNRTTYAQNYAQFFRLARSLAQTITLLYHSALFLVHPEHPLPSTGVSLFFALLPMVLSKSLIPNSPVLSHIIKVVLMLGRRFVIDDPQLQYRFVTELLTYCHAPTNAYETSATTAATPSSPAAHAIVHQSLTPSASPMRPGTPQRLDDAGEAASASPRIGSIGSPLDVKVFRESRSDVFVLFNPQTLIAAGDRSTFLQLVHMLASATVNLNAAEMTTLCSRLRPTAYVQSLEQTPLQSAEEARLFEVLPLLFGKSCLNHVATELLQYLLANGYQERVIRLLLTVQASSASAHHRHNVAEFRRAFIADLNFASLSYENATHMAEILSSCLPLPDALMSTAVALIEKLALKTPSFRQRLDAEHNRHRTGASSTPTSVFDEHARLVVSPSWNTIATFIERSLAIDLETSTPSVLMSQLLELLYDLVLNFPSLIDRLWYLLRDAVLPYAARHAAYHPTVQQPIEKLVVNLSAWQHAHFHYLDADAVPDLRTSLHAACPSVVALMFGRLPWRPFIAHLHARDTAEMSRLAVQFLALMLDVNTILPESVSSELRRQILGPTTNGSGSGGMVGSSPSGDNRVGTTTSSSSTPPRDESTYVPWRLVLDSEIAAVFDGTVLLAPLLSGLVQRTDPSNELVQNSLLLRDVALESTSPAASLACVREVRSLMCLVLNCMPMGYWHLPFKAHTSLFTSVLAPLTHQLPYFRIATKGTALAILPDDDVDDNNPDSVDAFLRAHVPQERVALPQDLLAPPDPDALPPLTPAFDFQGTSMFEQSHQASDTSTADHTAAETDESPLMSSADNGLLQEGGFAVHRRPLRASRTAAGDATPELPPWMSAPDPIAKEMVLAVVSCFGLFVWPVLPLPPNAARSIANANRIPFDPLLQPDATQEEFRDKMKGLVLQFCGAASPQLALEILRVAAVASTDGSGQICAPLLVELAEETLRTFFSHAHGYPLEPAAVALQFDATAMARVIENCIANKAAFTLLVILEQRKQEIRPLGTNEWSNFVGALMVPVTQFVPSAHRLFDAFPLWFFVLDIVNDERYNPRICQEKALQFLKFLQSQYESSFFGAKHNPVVVLAARATEIYFYRLMRDRSRSRTGDSDLASLVDRMQQLARREDMRPYASFFRDMDGILNPMFDLPQFKLSLIHTLTPSAKPLLEKLIPELAPKLL